MTNFKQYFRSHLKANAKTILFIMAAVLIFTLFISSIGQEAVVYDIEAKEYITEYYSMLDGPAIFLCILIFVIPVMEFSFFKKRINLDCAYSLPISRRSMGMVHYLTGLITLLGTFTASYLLNFIIILTRGADHYNLSPMITHYFLCVLYGSALYSVLVFVFNEANTKGDGIWFMILYTFVFVLIVDVVLSIVWNNGLIEDINWHLYNDIPFAFTPWAPIVYITEYFEQCVEKEHFTTFPYFHANIYATIFWIALGIASTIGFVLSFGKRRMEKTEDISDSFFGFRTLIPICAIFGMISFSSYIPYPLFWLIIEIIAIIGYAIYRRSLRFKKSEIIFLCSLLIFLLFSI